MSRLVPGASAHLRCALCHEESSGGDLAGCSACGTRFHDDCRMSARSCPTLGCLAPFSSSSEPHVACATCWRLRPREQEACTGCGDRLQRRVPGWPATQPLASRLGSWFLRAIGLSFPDHAAIYLAVEMLLEGRLDEAAEFADEAVRRCPDVARAFLARGRVFYAQGRMAEALIDLDRALELEPADPEAWLTRGYTRARAGDRSGARDDLTQSLRLEPGWATTWTHRAAVASADHREEEAERDIGEALRLEPRSVDALTRRCVLRGERGDLAGALADAEKALAAGPRSVTAWNNRGWVRLERREDLAAASSDLDQALALDPVYVLAFVNRAQVRARLGDFEGGARDGQRAIELAPGERSSWFALANVHDWAGDFLAAMRVIDDARARLGLADLGLRFFRAGLTLRRGQRAAAIEEFRALIDARPRSPAVWSSRAGARLRAGEHRAALEDAEIAVMLAPGKAFPFAVRGSIRASLDDMPGAEADFERALEIDRRDLTVRAHRALARTRNGQTYGAVADWDEVLRRAHEDVQPWIFARALREGGRPADARVLCERVLPGRPRDVASWRQLSLACAELGDAAAATTARERALALDSEAVAAWDALKSAEVSSRATRG